MTTAPATERGGAPAHTGSRGTRILGVLTLIGMATVVFLGLVVTAPDEVQGDAARLIFVHVPVVIVMNIAFFLTFLGSVMWLWKKSAWWDAVAVSSAEVGVIFVGLGLATGMIWGRPTWGVYWTWDARLTSTALLFLLYLGYLVIRRIPAEPHVRNRRSAWVAILAFIDVPIVYESVNWWRSLHQTATISLHTEISGLRLFDLMLGMVVFLMAFCWLLVHRFRVTWLEEQLESRGLDVAIAERRSEAGVLEVAGG